MRPPIEPATAVSGQEMRHVQEAIDSYPELAGALNPMERLRLALTVDWIAGLNPLPQAVCDLATFGAIDPVLADLLGLKSITTTGYPSESAPRELTFKDAQGAVRHRFVHDRFDVEESFPYADASFDLVIFTEVLEHLSRDPMATLAEIHRITKPGGWLMLTTPNCASLRSVLNVLRGGHPYVWSPYSRAGHRDRHNREYTPEEVRTLIEAAGYAVQRHQCLSIYDSPWRAGPALVKKLAGWLLDGFRRVLSHGARSQWNGDTQFVLARKACALKERFPAFLYY